MNRLRRYFGHTCKCGHPLDVHSTRGKHRCLGRTAHADNVSRLCKCLNYTPTKPTATNCINQSERDTMATLLNTHTNTASTHPGWLLREPDGRAYLWRVFETAGAHDEESAWRRFEPDAGRRQVLQARGYTVTEGPGQALFPATSKRASA